jgi:hypothetical protein
MCRVHANEITSDHLCRAYPVGLDRAVFMKGVKDSPLHIVDSGIYGFLAWLSSGSHGLRPQLRSAFQLKPHDLTEPRGIGSSYRKPGFWLRSRPPWLDSKQDGDVVCNLGPAFLRSAFGYTLAQLLAHQHKVNC